MASRITSTTVTFQRPFQLSGFDELSAAGTYTVDTEEEQITAISFPAWKRIATVIHMNRAGAVEYVSIDPAELKDALVRDGAQGAETGPPTAAEAKSRLDRARTPQLVRRKKF